MDYDIVIAGAGLVGLALARALADSGMSIALVDRAELTTPDPPTSDGDWDARVYAISPGSAAFLQSLSAWQALPHGRIAPIESMRVEGDAGALLNFSAYELGERALATIVEERALRAALVPIVRSSGIAIHAPTEFASLSFSPERAVLHCAGGRLLSARLIVGADGIRSWVRRAAGVGTVTRSYGQTAVVANFECERGHRGRAYQWFIEGGGVLAWLPLPGRRISIVWAAPDALAQELLALSAEALAARVAAAGRHTLGAFICITPCARFPLQSVETQTVVAHRLALVGDAAHGVHPLAGQGVNLGFGDAAALATILKGRGSLSDPGAPLLLARYARRRAEPVLAMQKVTDALARLFGSTTPGVRAARNFGMAVLERMPPAKRFLAASALR